jgi:NADH dehydrogenase
MSQSIVIAGAGYAGLHVALRLDSALGKRTDVELVLVDRHPYHQVTTELPRVASGARESRRVRIPVEGSLSQRVSFVQSEITGFNLQRHILLTGRTSSAALAYTRLVVALGSQTDDRGIRGLATHALNLYSSGDAERVWAAVQSAVRAAHTSTQQRHLTVLVGGGGPTGVEIAGELAETLPALTKGLGLASDLARVVIVEAAPRLLAGFSQVAVDRAARILEALGVVVRTDALIMEATSEGFTLATGEVLRGDVLIWTAGLRAPDVVARSELPLARNSRVRVDEYLRASGRPEIYVAGDVAAVVDQHANTLLAPLAQVALDEAECVARNLEAELAGRPLEPFRFHSKGVVVSVGPHRGVADLPHVVVSGRLAHTLKDLIEWEYRQSVQHLHGWSPV